MSNNAIIRKAKMVDVISLDAEYEELLDDKSKEKISLSRTTPTHEDLRGQIKRLRKHLALICEQIVPKKEIKDIDEWYVSSLEEYEVKGFVLSGYDETEGVMLIGTRTLASGMTLNLNSPKMKWDNDTYPHVGELQLNIEACVDEVKKYLFEGKRAPDVQTALDFDTQPELSPEMNEQQ